MRDQDGQQRRRQGGGFSRQLGARQLPGDRLNPRWVSRAFDLHNSTGYWVAASDAGIFTFGDKPVVGMACF